MTRLFLEVDESEVSKDKKTTEATTGSPPKRRQLRKPLVQALPENHAPLAAEEAMEAALPVFSWKMASLAHALHIGLKEQAASSP